MRISWRYHSTSSLIHDLQHIQHHNRIYPWSSKRLLEKLMVTFRKRLRHLFQIHSLVNLHRSIDESKVKSVGRESNALVKSASRCWEGWGSMPCTIDESKVKSVGRESNALVKSASRCWEGWGSMPPRCHELWDPLSCCPALDVMADSATVVGVVSSPPAVLVPMLVLEISGE